MRRRLERRAKRASRRLRPKRVDRLLGRIHDAASELESRLVEAPYAFERAAWRARQVGTAARTAVGRAREQRDDWTLHEARIAIKKWRYTLECVDEIAVGVQARSIAMLREIQETLGTLHDRAALVEAIERFARDEERPGLRTLIEELEAEKRTAMQEFLALAEALGERRARAASAESAPADVEAHDEPPSLVSEPRETEETAQQRWEQMARWLVKENRRR
jgi:CHAD domain-containing protein